MPMKTRDQAERRRTQETQDQHGRRWGGTIEIDTGVFTGPIVPVGWRAPVLASGVPLLPPLQYLRFDANRIGEFRIDYASWRADALAAEQGWKDRLYQYAKAMYGDASAQAIEHPSGALLELVGPKPVIPAEMVQACLAENRYALGLTDKVPDWAREHCTPRVVQRTPAELREQFPDADDDAPTGGRRRTAATT